MNPGAQDRRPIFLIGFMGVGKTTVGQLLARRLGRSFCDLDLLVQERTGRSIPELFQEHGEAGFRAQEAEALLIAARGDAVVAVGGGAPAWEVNLSAMKQAGTVVLLSAETQDLLQRLGTQQVAKRPLLSGVHRGQLAEHIATLYSRRAAAYAKADLVVDTTGSLPEQVVDLITERMRLKTEASP